MDSSAFEDDYRPCDKYSVHNECRRHEDEHKWIVSQRAGHDLGEKAIEEWVRNHWHGYLRARWVEHLQGKCFWIELEQCEYGLLRREFYDEKPLLDEIMGRLARGEENLLIILWAVDQGFSAAYVERIIRILTSLDVNSSRLLHRSQVPPEPVESHDDALEPLLAASA